MHFFYLKLVAILWIAKVLNAFSEPNDIHNFCSPIAILNDEKTKCSINDYICVDFTNRSIRSNPLFNIHSIASKCMNIRESASSWLEPTHRLDEDKINILLRKYNIKAFTCWIWKHISYIEFTLIRYNCVEHDT